MINTTHKKYISLPDQDYINIIYMDHIHRIDNSINYLTMRKQKPNLQKILIVHLIQKPWVTPQFIHTDILQLYNFYLSKTQWSHYV